MTIAIIDAGIGGLSVHAMLDDCLRQYGRQLKYELLFFNVMPASGKLYLHMQEEERIRTFKNMLERVVEFKPSIVLLACNSLSVLLPHLSASFVKENRIVGIVDFGVELVANHMSNHPEDNVLVLGTPITIASNAHKNKLLERGMAEDKIVTQGCWELQYYIQQGDDVRVERMMKIYFSEAKSKIRKPSDNIGLALCCTHYYFAEARFKRIAQETFGANITILNPNKEMLSAVRLSSEKNDSENTEISNQVYSYMEIRTHEIRSIGALLKKDHPRINQALKNYTQLMES